MAAGTTQRKQAEETRAALLAAARQLFATQGYQATSIDDITAKAGVTRGALYHHFEDKSLLFRAVYEAFASEWVQRERLLLAGAPDAWAQFRQMLHTHLGEAARSPEMQRIGLNDAPSALGLTAWRELSSRYGVGFFEEVLTRATNEGAIPRQPVTPVALMLLAALESVSLFIAEAPHPEDALQQSITALDRLLDGLTAPIET